MINKNSKEFNSASCYFILASDTSESYYPMLFSTDSMLEEMYCVCIQLVNKTWKEMRATSRDFSRV